MDLNTAGPLVLDTLTRACSQSADVLKPAEQQLKQWETQPGFYSILLSIFSNHEIDVNVRWLAVLYFKNGVDKYWRKMAPNAFPEEEKALLRQQLIANFNEPVSQIATQLSVLIGKIARLDCPRSWQELVPTLLEAVRVDHALLQRRALLTLHHVVKTLASKRLAHDRKVFEELTSNIFGYILNLWNVHTEAFFKGLLSGSTDGAALLLSLEHSILALKVLRKMAVYGFKALDKDDVGSTFLKLVFERMEQFLTNKSHMFPLANDLLPKREKIVTLCTKVLLEVQENHSNLYVPFIRPSLEMAVRYNFTETGTDLIYERFMMNMFNLVRSILRCEDYQPAKCIEETKHQYTLDAYHIKMAFFSAETLGEICRRLLSQYFLLTQEDLQCWDNDPEDYISADAGGDSWKFSLRPCTENLYLTLFKEFREILTPVVINLVQQIQHPCSDTDLPALLKKDAVYNSVGLASFDLYDDIDFNQWFTSHLIQELQNKHINYRIIRRRVVWLLGCWVGIKLSVELRPTLYETILPLLESSEDLVVRIEAALTLKTDLPVDDFEFKTEQFLPYLESSFSLLFKLLQDVVECETKMQILHVMSFVIERMGANIRPYSGALIQYLPMLWTESADHNMLRCAILTTLINLVLGLGVMCVNMYDFLLPVIKLSTDINQEPHVYLIEDGLDLWLMTLQCSPQMTPGLIDIYQNLLELFDYGTETLRTCLKITESYLLLGPNEFMEKYSSGLVSSLTGLLSDLRSEGIVMVLKVIELIFKIFPAEGPRLFCDLVLQAAGAILDGQLYPMEISLYMSLMSRLLLQDRQYFMDVIEQLARHRGHQGGTLLGNLLDSWCEATDNLVQPERKKLCSLALSSLLPCSLSPILERFGLIINNSVETLHDVCRLESDSLVDVLVITESPDVPADELDTEHDKRKRQLSFRDPVHTVNLRTFVLEQLTRCQQQHGQQGFEQLMELVDPDVATQLQTFMK